MDGYNIYPGPELRGKTPWPLVASSLWLRLGFVGATGAVVALIELYKGEAGLLAALAWIFAGVWLTALSWRRAKVLHEQAAQMPVGDAHSIGESFDTVFVQRAFADQPQRARHDPRGSEPGGRAG